MITKLDNGEFYGRNQTYGKAEFYRLGADNRYHIVLPDAESIYRSEVVSGFWLRVSWLWQTPLPPSMRVLAEIAGVSKELIEAFEQALMGVGEGRES
ncbi:TPA: hypothetical protein EYP66_00615 [Candidatus Poribacteria bacterium]|nr:hypothetical protein [Candidatus Poribacteria bacterium]